MKIPDEFMIGDGSDAYITLEDKTSRERHPNICVHFGVDGHWSIEVLDKREATALRDWLNKVIEKENW